MMVTPYRLGILNVIWIVMLLSGISAQENIDPLRHRSLNQETQVMVEQALPGYYIVEVHVPVAEETYHKITARTAIEGFLYPKFYIIKADAQLLQQLRNENLIYGVWHYTHAENYDHSISSESKTEVRVSFFSSANPNEILSTIPAISTQEQQEKSIILEIDPSEVSILAQQEGIEWIEPALPHEIVNDVTVTITGTKIARQRWNVYGAGETIAIADTGLDRGVNDGTMHNDFQGRISSIIDLSGCCSTSPDDKNGHGTHVAGIALGNGVLSGSNPSSNSYDNSYAGVAPKAGLIFQAIGSDTGSNIVYPPALIAGLFQPAYNQGARVHSDSWGVNYPPSFGLYQGQARDIDQFIWNNKDMNIVFAVGNWAYQNGAYQNDTIATHAVAKNAISVGASENYKPLIAEPSTLADNPDQIFLSSGRGPTDDGRIKPDVVVPGTEIFSTRSRAASAGGMCTKNQSVTPGLYNLGPDYATCTGSSMATPHVAGMVAILREFYKKQHINPSAALIKATLINSAVEMGYGLPSTVAGWGRVDLTNILPRLKEMIRMEDTMGLATGQNRTCTINNIKINVPFKATLVWSDPAAVIGSVKDLVNDLDLKVINAQGTVYNGNDFSMPFNSTRDDTNNVEQVIIPSTSSNNYTVQIKAQNVPIPNQPFALVITYEKTSSGNGPQQAPMICTR